MLKQSLEERLETLESQREEFDLLKTEIKQTLVDLKEAIIKNSGNVLAFSQEPQSATLQSASNGDLSPVSHEQLGEPPPSVSPSADENNEVSDLPAPSLNYRIGANPSGNLDAAMMGNIIWWLGTAKRRGLTFQLLTPILEAYEMHGSITHIMSKLILRSMADLDDLEDVSGNEFSPQDYADGLLQLHDIICTPGYMVDRMIPLIPAVGQDTAETRPMPQQQNSNNTGRKERSRSEASL